MIAPPEAQALGAFADRLDGIRRGIEGTPHDSPGDLSPTRCTLDESQAEAEALGRPELVDALRRLGLMTEVWECLAADGTDSAREAAAFCAEASRRLADEVRGITAGDQAAWVVRESSRRWSDYLELLDPSDSGTPRAPLDVPDLDEAAPAFDPALLLQMLTGNIPPAEASPPPPPLSRGERGILGEGNGLAPPREVGPGPESPPPLIELDPEIREVFLADASDLFERIEALVLKLDGGHDQAGTLHELDRCYHTLKGAAGSVGLVQLAAQIHSLEDRLNAASGVATPELIDQLHESLKYFEGVLISLGQGKSVGHPSVTMWDQVRPRPTRLGNTPALDPGAAVAPPQATDGLIRVPSGKVDELMDLASELIGRRGLWAAQARSMKEFAATITNCRNRLSASVDRLRDLGPAGAASGLSTGKDPAGDVAWEGRRLAELAEDLAVVAEAARTSAVPLADDADALSRLSLQLWETLQAIRVVPAGCLFQRLARVARDAARIEGRDVEVVTLGDETGIDRTVQDKAFEPLLHVVRNAVGHGIEPAEDRVKGGKPASGRVTLRARREGNTLVLSVQDDGRGLDYAAIAAKGRRLGLIGAGEEPSLERLNALVFQAGFSTRQEANAISGRGVGMDVVAQEVGLLRGTIALASEPGLGTTLTICLPARLSLGQAMVVRVDGQAFALPFECIELAGPFEPETREGAGADATVRVREHRARLIDAREVLGLSSRPRASCPKLLLVQADGERLAIQVDAIDGPKELMIRPPGPLLAGHPVISGTSLSVSGELILVLNPSGLAGRLRPGLGLPPIAPARGPVAQPDPVLVVDDSVSVRRVAARQLRSLGFEVDEAFDGVEALRKMRGRSYRMILTDLEMPHMDGFELLGELRRSGALATTPVLVSSTRADPATRRRALELGARAFVAKPVGLDDLARAIGTLVGP